MQFIESEANKREEEKEEKKHTNMYFYVVLPLNTI